MKPQLKIYGLGWVGKSMKDLFPEAWVHDPELGFVDDRPADIGVICVPTPLLSSGLLDCSIVRRAVREAPEELILIRSTVMPGTCDLLEDDCGKSIVFQPEYLGESVAHPMLNPNERQFVILGGSTSNRAKIIELYQQTYNANVRFRQVTNYEAEVIKLTENRAIAFKIAQCQELYDACHAAGVDYNTIREAVYGDDPRFNLWWTFIYPEQRGFNSKCIPKDVYGWASWSESFGYTPRLTKEMLAVNEELYINELQRVAARSPRQA